MQATHAIGESDVIKSHCPGADNLIAELDQASHKEAASILIVDDQPVNLRIAEAFLHDDGYRYVTLCDSPELVPSLVQRHGVDVVLLDIMMPRISGIEVLKTLRTDPATRYVPVIVLTASTDRNTKSEALQLGATDFLTKPLDAFDLLPRVRNALVLRAHQRNLENQSQAMEKLVRERTAELVWTQIRVIHCLARASEHRDNETGRHAVRVGRYARIIAEQLGMQRQWCEDLMLAAMLHDVGKIGVPDEILLKPGKLDVEEFRQMQNHCQFGKEIISPPLYDDLIPLLQTGCAPVMSEPPLLQLASRIAATHHERWDGAGYPSGLKGEDIPLEGRITAVADVFDAVNSMRPYKPTYPLSRCREIICEGAGGHFDPKVVLAFLAGFDDILTIRKQLQD